MPYPFPVTTSQLWVYAQDCETNAGRFDRRLKRLGDDMSLILILSAAASAVGFQQYDLGMSLEQARAVPIAAGDYGAKRLSCTGDGDESRFLRLTPAEASLGIVKCWPMQTVGSTPSRADIEIGGGISATTEFLFSQGRLFEIQTYYDFTRRTPLESALRLRFGEPTGQASSTLQNLYGAQFEQQTLVWVRDGQSVNLIAPALNLERMAVIYRDDTIADAIYRLIEATDASELSI